MTVARCSDCESESREGGQFCEACGAKIEPEIADAEPEFAPMPTEDEGPAASVNEPEMAEPEPRFDPMAIEDQGLAASVDEDEGVAGSMSGEEEGVPDSAGEPESGIGLMETQDETPADSMETEDEASGDSMDAEDELPAQPPKAGYLIFPDETEQPIPPSQWLIGRADLERYLPDPEKANEISRGHLTVFQEGERFFIEDGKTMVQRRPSANKTWLVRGSDRILVTGTGRNELQDDDEIDVAELVKLQFVMK
jgi:hypothetical protein